MKKITGLITCCIFLIGCAHFSNVREAQNDIWAAISYQRGGGNEEIVAKLDRATFNGIVDGKIRRGWLEIGTTYWTKCGKRVPAKEAGKEWGYGNRFIIRPENITRIIPLSAEAVLALEGSGEITPSDTTKPCP